MPRGARAATFLIAACFCQTVFGQQQEPRTVQRSDDSFRFKSGVELINVTATVFDPSGRFVPGLQRDDFVVYEDDRRVDLTHFSDERVPVSLGVALDTSGSMAGEKIREAQGALERFAFDLLDAHDELFIYTFSNYPMLLQDWTTDRHTISRKLSRVIASGGTAMYDTVAEALPLVARGRNQKKALVIISDGNDTSSHTEIRDVKQMIREKEVLVYAVGIDGEGEPTFRRAPPTRTPLPFPFPPPIGGRGRFPGGSWPQIVRGGQGGWNRTRGDDRVNATALREMTDDSGGRTEIIRDPRDLNPATAAISDELSKQYYLGYPSAGKRDGRWHSIRVEVKDPSYRVRARRGYVAS
jgi:Ca-activated chloride channel family protein